MQRKSTTLRWNQSGSEREVTLPLAGCAWASGETIRSVGVCLHGFGDESSNFLGVAKEIALPGVLWVALDGPYGLDPRMGLAGGRMWFDLFSQPWKAIEEAKAALGTSLGLLLETCGLPPSKLFLLGFSQGGFMALHTGLSRETPPAAVVSLSGFLMGPHRLPSPNEAMKAVPLFIGHGLQDQVVLPLWYYETLDLLEEKGYSRVRSHTYEAAHSLHPDEVRDVREFLKGVI